ncbi:efflux RND transporter permease subunit [Candidatus Poribacteria bacterium]|nr:efflux RND transporter permease subunit [Candidatus Poribacteria bacterium]MYK21486.1 efflux RND transporter permease subunit [Candidatus Poribacteria bacterium]
MINQIIEICMKNRLLVLVIFVFVTMAGWWALNRTPIDAMPDIGENQVIVFADWPGRSPRDIEDQVIYPLSITMLGIPDVKDVRSTSMFSFGYINIIFKDDIDFYWARTRVLERMNLAQKDMPDGVVPLLGPDATGVGQVFWYTVENGYYCPNHPTERYAEPGTCPEDGKTLITSNLELHELRTLQDWTVRYYLASADGVSEVASVGGYVKQYQIDIDPNTLLAYNVPLSTVYNAVRGSNLDVGAKVIEEGGMEFLIRGLGFIKSIADIENIVVKEHNGVPIYVKNLGTVSEGPDFRRGALDKAGIPATGGVVLMRYGDNPLRVIENVKAKIAELTPGLPSGVRIVPFYDRSHLIHRATDTLKETLTEEIIVAAAVILLFLGQVSSSLLIALVLPMGVLLSFVGMRIIGLPSNIMSMGGIAIAIGVMVDAGIVMTENITRHLQEPHPGESKLQVATRAAKEVGPPIFFAMLIVIVAFIPVFSLTGQAGKLFKPLAYTKTFAMLGAALIAISLVPVLASFLLADPTRIRTGRVSKMVAQFFAILSWPLRKLADGITWVLRTLYRPIIRLAVKNIWTKLAVVALAVLIFAASIPLTPFYKNIGQEFMPPLNEGALLFMPVLLPGASITQAKDVMAKQNLIMNRFPEISLVVGKLGRAMTATDPAPIGMFETIVNIIDPAEWPRRAVKRDATAAFVSILVQRLARDGLISEEHVSHISADFLEGIVTAAVKRFDTLATTYHNPYLLVDEREKLYRIWFLRVLLEELLAEGHTAEMGLAHVKIGESETEVKLHQIAEEIEPTLKHKTYFRTKNRNELITELTEATRMPGVSPIMTQPIRNRVDMLATGIQTPIGIKVFGKDLAQIEEIAVRIEQELLKLEGALGPYAERIGNKPYLEFHINREETARYGIQIKTVQQIIMTAIGGMNLTYTVEGRERFPIRIRYMRELRDNIEALKRVLVPTPKGLHIPLEQLVRIERRPGPAKIASENTLLFSRVFCDVDVDTIGLVDFVTLAQKTLDEKIKPTLPQGYFYAFSGQYEAELEARNRLRIVVPVCITAIFILLYLQFKSPSAMFSIFLAIPFAFIGGMWMQALMAYVPEALGGGYAIKYSTAVWVGYIALFGIAVEDGIVLIEYLLQRVRGGEPIDEAVINAGLLRVRPIIMTTATTILALLPIMLAEISTTTGAELMKPIAVPTFGGMVSATMANLILAPVLFSLFYPVERWIRQR